MKVLAARVFSRISIGNSKRFSHNLSFVRIVEVGPRDGLQNVPAQVPTDVKINFINQLNETGLKSIEITSFVSPKWIPRLADHTEVYQKFNKKPGMNYPVLVPNKKGLEDALEAGVEEIAIFTVASEQFSHKNTNCSIEESFVRLNEIVKEAVPKNLRMRGYVGTVVGCPFEGAIKPKKVTEIVELLLSLGCYEVSLGDTIGVGTKTTFSNLLKDVLTITTPDKLGLHCHDTYGQALMNIATALDFGVTVFDASVAGLGGCPFAPGATGNVATEDLIYMLHGMGLETGVDLDKMVDVGEYISEVIGRPPASNVNNALRAKRKLKIK